MSQSELWNLGIESIHSLEVERGILASGRGEAYGCIFGRDSLITALALLQVGQAERSGEHFFPLTKKILSHLGQLQGVETNIESGEEPGKIIHEFRPDNHQHLTAGASPWYVYPDGAMRNYDSIDATPLFLIALHSYGIASGDSVFIEDTLPQALRALEWLLKASEAGFISYSFPPERTHGGLRTQSWMDSAESLFYEENDETPPYPIAPLEAQAYAWAALQRWGEYLEHRDEALSILLLARARTLKKQFNSAYVLGSRSPTLAFALDGAGRPLAAPRSSMGHVLWAAYKGESILAEKYLAPIARRLLAPDLFVPSAGIRTLSSRSQKYDPHSYHNGSIWPHDNAMAAHGLEQFGFVEEARRVRETLLRSYAHFSAPLELFTYSRGVREYEPASGQRACRTQAWSAASLLATLAAQNEASTHTLLTASTGIDLTERV